MNEPIYVDMKWLEKKTNLKQATLRNKLLLPNQEELKAFVKFPERKGERWLFVRTLMEDWLTNNVGKWTG